MFRIVTTLVGLTIACAPVCAQEKVAQTLAKIEFRWLEDEPIAGVTEEKGFRTTCGDALSYAHKKPVLTNSAVAEARITHHDFSKSGLSSNLYTVALHLKDSARKTLVAECNDRPFRELAVFVDGKYWGTGFFRKAEAGTYVHSAGFMTSQQDAERVVAAAGK